MNSRFLCAALALGIGLVPALAIADELRQFSASSDLEKYIEDVAILEMERQFDGWGGGWGGPRPMMMKAADGGSNHSTTNVQVRGVDEPDYVKNDGKLIYKLHGESLVVVDATTPHSLAEVGRAKIEGWPISMFLNGDQVVVFSMAPAPKGMEREGGGFWGGIQPMAKMIWPGPRQQQVLKVTVFDVSWPWEPLAVRELFVEGNFVDARMVGTKVHVVTSNRTPGPALAYWTWTEEKPEPTKADLEALKAENRRRIRAATLVDWLPRRFDRATAVRPSLALGAVNCFRPSISEGRNVVMVTTLELGWVTTPKHVGLLAEQGEVYATAESLYMANYRWTYWWGYNVGREPADVSDIHKFNITGSYPRYLASGVVEGRVLNQFSMDEYQGTLRVATTTEATAQGGQPRLNHVFTLRPATASSRDLRVVGSIRDLAPDEQIYAVRFICDRGFVVTFRQVDPLFAIDMKALKVKGILKIDGFSTYLHPMGTDHLLAVGNAADAEGRVTGLDLTIFDVRDLSNPKLVHRRTLKGAYSQSLYEHKAFNFFESKGVLAIPLNDWANGFSGMEVYGVTTTQGFKLRGRIDHKDLAEQMGWTWGPEVGRSVIIRNTIYSISDVGIKSNLLSNPSHEHAAITLK